MPAEVLTEKSEILPGRFDLLHNSKPAISYFLLFSEKFLYDHLERPMSPSDARLLARSSTGLQRSYYSASIKERTGQDGWASGGGTREGWKAKQMGKGS